jgi:hypothetical protein
MIIVVMNLSGASASGERLKGNLSLPTVAASAFTPVQQV